MKELYLPLFPQYKTPSYSFNKQGIPKVGILNNKCTILQILYIFLYIMLVNQFYIMLVKS